MIIKRVSDCDNDLRD